ncbi:MAG: glycosyltransferase family 1 protein, partial [Desulfobacteraceae bacterium]
DVWQFNALDYKSFFSVPVLYRLNVATVGTCHGGDIQKMPEVNYGRRLDSFFDDYFNKSIRKCTLVTSISDTVRSEYLNAGVPPDCIRDVPNGLNINYIKGLGVDRGQTRKELNWPIEKLVLLTVGRNHPKKGYIYIPAIIKILLSNRNDFVWVIIGKGAEEMSQKAEKMGVGAFLQTIPQIGITSTNPTIMLPPEELVRAYKSADVFVFPTLLETFGNVQPEAMAAGLPVITTDAPGARDVVKHEVTGLISPVGDAVAMARNIERVLFDTALKEKLIRNGISEVEKYGWEKVAAKYCDVYEEAINKRLRKTT